MSLAASNRILRADTIGRGEPATLLWSEPTRAYHRGGPGHTDPTMCIRNVRAGAEPANTNKRPAYDTTDDQQHQRLLYRQHRAPEDAEYDGGRESKLRRLTPPYQAEEQRQPGGSAPAPWASQQQRYQQDQQLMEDTEPLAGGAQENPRLKRNKPVKWSAEEDRRLREAVVRVSGKALLLCCCCLPTCMASRRKKKGFSCVCALPECHPRGFTFSLGGCRPLLLLPPSPPVTYVCRSLRRLCTQGYSILVE